MNKERKARFDDVVAQLEEAKDTLSDIQSEEQDAYDAMPEGFQMGSRGDKMQEYIDLIDEAFQKIDDVISFVEKQIIENT